MPDTTRAEELVRAMNSDQSFAEEVQAAPTAEAKRTVLEQRGFGDVTLHDMKSYVESQGGTLVLSSDGGELSEEQLEAVAGGMTDEEIGATVTAVASGTAMAAAAAA